MRLRPRTADGDNSGSSTLDIGAVEAPPFMTVTTAADQNNSPPGANVSLREALAVSNGKRIVFASNLNNQIINLSSTAGGQGTSLGSLSSLNFIDASSLLDGITISGGNDLKVPLIASPKLLHGLTLTGGRWSAIRHFEGTLVMSSCTITSNTQADAQISQPYGVAGGGIFNGNVAFITDCIFKGNVCSTDDSATAAGAGYASFPSAGTGLIEGAGISYLPSGLATDARGFARKYGPKVDIGAYELGSFLPGTTDPTVDISGGNGIDDFWEEFYNYAPNNASVATSDNDMDGLSALGEYLSQTNPNVANTIRELAILKTEYLAPTGQVILTFSSSSGIAYQIWYSDDLSGNSFTKIIDVYGRPSASSTEVLIEKSTFGGGDKGFFRMRRP